MAIDPKPHVLDKSAEAILIGLLAYLPFAFGGVLPLSHFLVVCAAAAMAICLGLRNLVWREAGFVWSWSYLPVGLFVALVALQLVPLTIGWVSAVAPGTADIWKECLGDVPDVAASTEHVTLSLYPLATSTDLRLLLAAAVIFLVVVNVYRTRAQVHRLLVAMSVIGMGVVLLALLQHLTDSSTIFWIWDIRKTRSHTAAFIHPGHFAQFVNLSLGCAIGLLLARVAHRHAGRRLQLRDVHAGLMDPHRRFDLVLVVFIALGIVAVALSQSRNGLISMLVAAVVVTAGLQWSGFLTGFGWSLAGIILVAFVVLLVFGFDPVYERMSTLEDPGEEYEGRLAILRDAFDAWLTSPLLGTGQGTFEWAFPMFDQSTRRGTAQHAENQFVEFLVETGVVGLLLVLTTLGFVGRAVWRGVRGESSTPRAAAFGLTFGIVAVLFHAFTDFGLRIPAVAVLVTVAMGLLVALVSVGAKVKGLARVASVLLCLVPAGLLIWTMSAAWAATQAEQVWRSVKETHERLAPSFEGTPADFEGLLEHTRRAVELQPGNIEYRYWNAMHGWQLGLARKAEQIQAGNAEAADVKDLARVTQAALLASVRYAPTHGPTWAGAGDLGVGWLDEPDAASWIHRGMKLAPHHPTICLATGRQLLVEGKDAEAAESFRRAVKMGANWQVLESVLIDQLHRPGVAREVARGEPRSLLWLAGRLEKTLPAEDRMLEEVREEARVLMKKLSEGPKPPDWVFSGLAREHLRRGDDEIAVGYLRDYVMRVPRAGERLLLVQALVRLEKTDEARREVERFLRVHPSDNTARRLLLELKTK